MVEIKIICKKKKKKKTKNKKQKTKLGKKDERLESTAV